MQCSQNATVVCRQPTSPTWHEVADGIHHNVLTIALANATYPSTSRADIEVPDIHFDLHVSLLFAERMLFPKTVTSTHCLMLLKYDRQSCEPTLTRRGTLPQVQLQRSPPKLPAAATTMPAQYFMMFTAVPHGSGASCDDYLGEDQQTRAPRFLKLF